VVVAVAYVTINVTSEQTVYQEIIAIINEQTVYHGFSSMGCAASTSCWRYIYLGLGAFFSFIYFKFPHIQDITMRVGPLHTCMSFTGMLNTKVEEGRGSLFRTGTAPTWQHS